MVIDISGTFAFDEADTYTFTDINWTLVEDSSPSFSFTAEGTAMLNGEGVTFFSETTSSLEITNVGSPTNGTVVIVGGALQYTPTAGYIGDDSFIYTMTDLATGDTSSSTVFLGILDSNDTFTLDPSINTIDGGYGNDTLTIGHTFVDYAVGISPDGTVIIRDANNNVTTITEVEDFSFSDQAFDIAGLQASDDVRELFYEMVSDGVGGYDQVYVLPELFYDPNNAGLNELFDYTYTKPADDTQGDIIIGSAGNEFINSSGGDDAVDAGAGNDIIDGGLGSNFLTGGIGNDIFFADGRDAAIVETWTTITDFNAGTNSASLWGYIDGTSHYLWEENQGAGTVGGVDYNGVTFRGDLDGNGVIDTSFTFTGLTLNDISGFNQ
jgi:serralysin